MPDTETCFTLVDVSGKIMFTVFTRGFAAGAVTSVAAYAIYSSVIQWSEQIDETRSSDSPKSPRNLVGGSDIFKYGVPDDGSQARLYVNHALSYDQAKRIPAWVSEHITKADLQGSANRKLSNFKMDPNLSAEFSSMNSDYKNSGWSRGHMAPAADNKFSQEAMDETFYLTNILPQDIDNNMNFWNLMEIYCRDLTASFDEVRVISGPAMMPNLEEEGKQYVKYEVIGQNTVAAPTHLYKVIVVENTTQAHSHSNTSQTRDSSTTNTSVSDSASTSGGATAVGAFLVPNAKIDSSEHGLKDYQVPLEVLERAVGISFLPKLNRSSVVDLCSVDPCQLKDKAQLDLFYITKRIEGANTLQRLEKSWAELGKRSITPSENLRNLYVEKKRTLEAQEKAQV